MRESGDAGLPADRSVADARAAWLTAATAAMGQRSFVSGVWLVGSLGRGTADAYSDVDLVVAVTPESPPQVFDEPVIALGLPEKVLFTRAKPRNAPAGGTYLAVCLDLAGVPVLIDLYVWPSATAAVPAGGRVLYARCQPAATDLEFMALLERHRTADPAGADPDHPATILFLVQLAAKYHARGDHIRKHGIHRQLQIPEHARTAALYDVVDRVNLDRWPQLTPAVAATHRLLRHAAAQAATGEPPA